MLRILILVCLLGCILGGDALACRGPGFNSTIFFDEFPVGIDQKIVARIVVTEIIDPAKFNIAPMLGAYYVGIARIVHVFKGQINGDRIIIVAPSSDCDIKLARGEHGIVAGNMQVAAAGQEALFLISESRYQRQLRKSRFK